MPKTSAQKSFSSASNSVASLEKKVEGLFKSLPLKVCTNERVYYLPGEGVVECMGIDTLKAGGLSIEVLVFANKFSNDFSIRRTPVSKLAELNLRELVSMSLMKTLEDFLGQETMMVSFPQKNIIAERAFFKKVIQTSNPVLLANVVRFVFPAKKNILLEEGTRALELLASEHAAVTGAAYEVSLRILSELVEKPSFGTSRRLSLDAKLGWNSFLAPAPVFP